MLETPKDNKEDVKKNDEEIIETKRGDIENAIQNLNSKGEKEIENEGKNISDFNERSENTNVIYIKPKKKMKKLKSYNPLEKIYPQKSFEDSEVLLKDEKGRANRHKTSSSVSIPFKRNFSPKNPFEEQVREKNNNKSAHYFSEFFIKNEEEPNSSNFLVSKKFFKSNEC